jgi:hypothetical protein
MGRERTRTKRVAIACQGGGSHSTFTAGARALRDSRPEGYLWRGDLCPFGLVRALEGRPRGGR